MVLPLYITEIQAFSLQSPSLLKRWCFLLCCVLMKPSDFKYREALQMYCQTRLPLTEICRQCNVQVQSFSAYMYRYHRDEIQARHGFSKHEKVLLRGKRGQSTEAHLKYKAAVEACGSLEFIAFNVSQIARTFGLDPSALWNQLKKHYPQILQMRDAERMRLGIAQGYARGTRSSSIEKYAEALELLDRTEMSVAEAAEASGVSYPGLRDYLGSYHVRLQDDRRAKRVSAMGARIYGGRKGNWTLNVPKEASVEKYAECLKLYADPSMTIHEIAAASGCTVSGLRHYMRRWHPDLVLARRHSKTEMKKKEQ